MYFANDDDATYASKADIQKYAEELSSKFIYPRETFIYDVCTELGIEISFENPLLEQNNFNGSIYINKDEEKIKITLSNLTSELRNNFTIAHEIGHLFLHSSKTAHRTIGFNRYGSGRLEWEANWFAAAFLMPKEQFLLKYKFFNGALYELALFFNVSESAVKIRKKDLGI